MYCVMEEENWLRKFLKTVLAKLIFKMGCASSVRDVGAESGIGNLSSNFQHVCCIHFCISAFGEGMNPFPHSQLGVKRQHRLGPPDSSID